jgi:hypothetical protein
MAFYFPPLEARILWFCFFPVKPKFLVFSVKAKAGVSAFRQSQKPKIGCFWVILFLGIGFACLRFNLNFQFKKFKVKF